MAFDEEVAAVIRERLAVGKTIDESAALSFLESAAFRLELIDRVNRFETGQATARETYVSLDALHRRVSAVIASAS